MTEKFNDGMKPLLDYVHNISSALFGVSFPGIMEILNTEEEANYALSTFATDSNVMALYVEWLRTEAGNGELSRLCR